VLYDEVLPDGDGLTILRSLPHGHVAAVLGTARKIELERLLATARQLDAMRAISSLGAPLGLRTVANRRLTNPTLRRRERNANKFVECAAAGPLAASGLPYHAKPRINLAAHPARPLISLEQACTGARNLLCLPIMPSERTANGDRGATGLM
jgi:hypothetical protein